MGFTKKTWKNRIAEYINRRLLTMEDGSTNLVTVARDEGTISQEGDAFNAANMNDLEDRIEAGFEEVSQSLTNILDFTTCDKLAQTASTTDINIALDKNINDYKFIVLGCINGGRLLVPSMITVALFKIFANKHVMIGSGNSIIKCIYIDDMHIKLSCVTADYQAVVYGIK